MRAFFIALLVAALGCPSLLAQDIEPSGAARQRAQQLIDNGELESALQAIGQQEISPADARSLRRKIASAFLRQRQIDRAYALFEESLLDGIESAVVAADLIPTKLDLVIISQYAISVGRTESALRAIDNGLNKVQSMSIREDECNAIEFPMALAKIQILSQKNDIEGAGRMLADYVTRARQLFTSNPANEANRRLLYDVLEAGVQFGAGDDVAMWVNELRELAANELRAGLNDANAVENFVGVTLVAIAQLLKSDPNAVEAVIEDARTKITAIKEANEEESIEQITQILAMFERSLKSMETRVEAAKLLANLIGNPAPAIDAQYWVNGTATDLEALKGKVVLIDFWAVWCGPCIATFSHLRSLHDEFANEGLEIIGVTRKYNYAWDEEAKRASRAEEEQSDEAELAMLEKFLAHHELEHPTIITPPTSEMNKNYGVSGIPHVVLIDKQGVVQLIKVGSGEANAKAIHEKIVELLAE